MQITKGSKMFEINFSDSDEDNQYDLSSKQQKINTITQTQPNYKQNCQCVHQINNQSLQQSRLKKQQQINNSQDEIGNNSSIQSEVDSNLSSQKIPVQKNYYSQRKAIKVSQLNNKSKFSSKSPFIIQEYETQKSNRNKHYNIQQKRIKLTNQKKKIQKFNESLGVQSLEQIKLQTILKRSDTSTTEQSLKGRQSQQQKSKMKRSIQKSQQSNQPKQSPRISSKKQNSEDNQNDEILNEIATQIFRQFRSFSFDSEFQQVQSHSQRFEEQYEKQEDVKSSDNSSQDDKDFNKVQDQKEKAFNIFSQSFFEQKYRQSTKVFLKKLLHPRISPQSKQIENNKQGLNKENCQIERINQNRKRFLTTQIPQDYMFQFQVHVYKDLLKTQYQLWVKPDYSSYQSILIANAQNDSFHIDKINNQNTKEFVGQLQSNFTRQFYSLHGYHHTYQYIQNNHHKLIFKVKQILNMNFTVDRVAYLPKLNHAIHQHLQSAQLFDKNNFSSQNLKNLKQKYQTDKFTNQNTTYKLIPSKNIKFDLLLNKQLGVRDSKKTILMQSSSNNDKLLFIGKIASKKYKVLVGQGISPLQAFGMVISHVEVN